MNSFKYILYILLVIWVVLVSFGIMRIPSNKLLTVYIIVLLIVFSSVALIAYFITTGALL